MSNLISNISGITTPYDSASEAIKKSSKDSRDVNDTIFSGDTKYKSRAKKDLGLNQFNIGYEAQLGYKNLILYGKYIPGGIFKSSSRPDLRSLSFGVVIGDVFN